MTQQPDVEAEKIEFGAEFHRASPDDFRRINKAANAQGLMAHVFELKGEAGSPDMLISFELVRETNGEPR